MNGRITFAKGTKFLVQGGKGKSRYQTRWEFDNYTQAAMWHGGINTHSGYKKRLVAVYPNGTRQVIARYISV